MSTLIGIDLGGTNMQIGVVDDRCTVIGRCRRKTRAELGAKAVIERVAEGVRRACEDAGCALSDIAAVGIGVPGAIDMPRGVVLSAPNLQWFDLPVRELFQKALGRPVVVDNDVNVATWGEANLGAGRGHTELAGIWVGTGVGGGFVLGGKLYRGAYHTAGEVGQTISTPFGGPAKRTLEQHASRTGMVHNLELLLLQHPKSMLHELRAANEGRIGSKELAAAYLKEDPAAVEVIEHAALLIGASIANIVTLLSLSAVVVGGGVTEALGDPFLKRIRKSFDRWVFPSDLRACTLVITELVDDAGVLGAALLARELAQTFNQTFNQTPKQTSKQSSKQSSKQTPT